MIQQGEERNSLFPPDQVGTWVDASTQDELFEQAWSRLQTRFFKLETLQWYDESGVPIFEAWQRGDRSSVHDLAKKQAEEQASDPIDQRITCQRVRLLSLPVTDYVRFEAEVYRYLAEAGEQIFGIEAIRASSEISPALLDFLLFDDFLVFVHDYDKTGKRHGSWVVEADAEIRRYRAIADQLVRLSRPFTQLEEQYF